MENVISSSKGVNKTVFAVFCFVAVVLIASLLGMFELEKRGILAAFEDERVDSIVKEYERKNLHVGEWLKEGVVYKKE